MNLQHRRRAVPAGHKAEQGAVLVEFALVAIILVTLLAATFDFGLAWRAGLGVTEAARAGTRVGSSVANDPVADISLLTSSQAALASSGLLNDVTRVVVFRATSSGVVPTPCKTGSGSGECNIFTGDQFRAITSGSARNAQGCITNSVRRGWCPTARNRVQLNADYIGVWIQVRFNYNFKVLGEGTNIERTSVMRLEPS